MKKSIILLGAFTLLLAAPSFCQTQESTQATSTEKSEKTVVLQKQKVKSQKKKAKSHKMSMKAQNIRAVKSTQANAKKETQKSEVIQTEDKKAVRKESQ